MSDSNKGFHQSARSRYMTIIDGASEFTKPMGPVISIARGPWQYVDPSDGEAE